MSYPPWPGWAALHKQAIRLVPSQLFSSFKLFCAFHVTVNYLCTPGVVYGTSMHPTFSISNTFVIADKISPRLGKVGTGDVVVIRSVVIPRLLITKRVVGVEGDTVTYLVDPKNSERTKTLVVPKGHVWIEGDNIYDTSDSREFGPVPYGLIHGRVFWKIWPRHEFGPVRGKEESVEPTT